MKKINLFKYRKYIVLLLGLALPILAMASVDSSLNNIYNKVVGTYLPLAAVLGLVFSGFSFVSGNENAKRHLWLAILGAVVGFGASSIISLIRSLVN